MESSHNIVISVDASRARQGLAELSRQAQGTAQSLRSLGSTSSGFDTLAKQVAQTSGAFQTLARSLAAVSASASRISALSGGNHFGGLSRGAHDAHAAVTKLSSSLNPLHAAFAGLGALAGGLSLQHFTKSILETGNAVTSFKLALDSVATDSGEANRMFDYIAATSNRLGVSLESNLETFKNLRVSMASLGIDTQRTQALFENFGKAFTALHTTQANVKRGFYDISEVFSLGKLDATRARAISTHVPGFIGALQESLKDKSLHDAFRQGIPAAQIEEVGKILGAQYSKAATAALDHAQANLAIMGNKFTLFKADVFDNGFDSGLTTFLKEMNAALDGAGFKNFGATIGEGFRQAFAAATMFGKALISLREPLAEVLKIGGMFAASFAAFGLIGGAIGLLSSPLAVLSAATALAITQWERLTAIWNKAALGAVELGAVIKGLASGHSLDESKNLARIAGDQFLASQAGAKAGESFSGSFLDKAKKAFDLDKWKAEYDSLLKSSNPADFHGVSDYNLNATRRDEILLRQAEHAAELSNKLKTLREQLLPTTSAFDKLRDVLEKIESMRGKKIGDHAISDSELNRMRDAAKENAFSSAFPAASRIRDLSDAVRIDSEALAASGGNRDLMREEKQFLQERLTLKRKGVDLTNEESAALKALIHSQAELAKGDQNPLTRWASSQKDGIEGINSSIEHGLDATADALARIAVEGKSIKDSMRSLLSSIASDFLRQGIRSLMAEGIKGLNLSSVFGGASDSVKAALGMGESVVSAAQSAVDDAAKSLASTTTPLMEVQAGVVNINGALGGIGATGSEAFKPASDLSKAIRPASVGGVAPLAKATGPVFGNDNALGQLPGFKDNVKTGFGSIPSNSSSLFGRDLLPALGALPGFKDALKSGAAGITRNSVAAFGAGLQKLPTAAESITAAGLKTSKEITLTPKEITDLKKTLMTEWVPSQGDLQGKGIIDTILNRKASGHWGGSITDVVNAKSQFSAINGRPAWKLGRNGVDDIPDSVLKAGAGKRASDLTDKWLLERSAGAKSVVGDNLNYANRAVSDRVNWSWIDRLKGPQFGAHRHGTTSDLERFRPGEFGVKLSGRKAVDMTPTGSIQKLSDQAKRHTQEIEKQLQAETKLVTEMQKSSQSLNQVASPLTNFDGGVGKLSETMSSGIPATESFGSEIEKLIQKLLSGLGGGGGDGLLGGVGSILGGLFEEGGYSGSPVASAAMPASFWAGAPHYAEGTPNTSGGMPAILHDNEAVVPLSRGRSIPVELSGDGVGGGNRQTIVQNFATNITARDHDSFRRNHNQVMEAMQKAAGRARARNG